MKTLTFASVLFLLALPLMAGGQGVPKADSGWFDMEGCAFCSHLTEDPGLLSHMTWESHKIENGSMTVAVVEPAFRASYEKAGLAMQELGNKMMNGEINPMTVKMCGHCMMFGQIMMAGADMEHVHGEVADVSLITSDDPDVVKMIHMMVERDNEEASHRAKDAHHDHDHDHGHDHEHGHQH